MWQKITIVGNLGSDPDMRYTPSGVPVTSFSVAVNRKVKLQDGSLQDKTTWFRVTAWRQLAETCSQYLSKGRMVLIEGEVEASAYMAQDGTPRASLELTARDVRFLGNRTDAPVAGAGTGASAASAGSGGGAYNAAPQRAAPRPASTAPGAPGSFGPPPPEIHDEEIPF
ncbi:single-stranded DNA-binding protein [Candidatus Amarolinea dominans]|jgi:single-strand DNA-binding protein|uniref:single-stranded DNA-binding protein n=1 Tax=Candidatus Amarolinea dominans TaxID=3140696 RepID=UPI001DA39B84|nr:single-stranded DNA-binding protein [Anaerolineae bacterium]MBK7199368.1 single-stranded DNA-binding protein [Anaerolineae bacterium]MBK9093120.1 single-stranded DNA-binding protein [Anaerolineae bacterium]MBK9230167.1 single-stranded DNA-binding protein [Anaerolineae bacterium]